MEEMFDTYDRDGNFLGVKPKSFCHSENPNCYHKPVWVLIVNDRGDILVQRRALSKKLNPGKWDISLAGHVDSGEESLEGCIRETREELGLETKKADYTFMREYVLEIGWELAQVYLLKLNKSASEMKLRVEEVAEVRWLSYGEFVQIVGSDNKIRTGLQKLKEIFV